MSADMTATTPVDLEAASVLHAATADLLNTCSLLDYAPAGNAAATEIELIQSLMRDLRQRLDRAVEQLAPGVYH